MAEYSFSNYRARLYTGQETQQGLPIEATIVLDALDYKEFLLYFVPRGWDNLPGNEQSSRVMPMNGPFGAVTITEYHIHIPSRLYPWYLDLLRNEGPHTIEFDPAELDKFTLRVFEPTSEGE